VAAGGRARLSTTRAGRGDRSTLPGIIPRGQRLSFHSDLYHVIVRLGWGAFSGLATLAFLGLNALFAGLYMLSPGSVANARTFADHFFFSAETMSTVGYGVMAPQTGWAHAVVTLEVIAGIATTAIITGLTFVRFARPSARILFSDKMVICPRNGVPHLMFRMANWRRNQIADAQLTVLVLVTETTLEGETMRKPVPLPLVRDRNPMFALSWTAMHPIDASSPFFGDGLEKLRAMNAEIFLSLTGLDETLMQTIAARWRYNLDDIVKDCRFADILVIREDGVRIIDYDKFHDTVPLVSDSSR
jgi:inward rectifier potassium channel